METTRRTQPAVKLSGDLDGPNLFELHKAIVEALQSEGSPAVIDLSEVATISPLAMDMLILASKALQEKSRRLVIIGTHHPRTKALDFEAVAAWMKRGRPARAERPSNVAVEETIEAGVGNKSW